MESIFFRVMQGVAWLLSVLVIGINMFFVAEYVVSYETSLHFPPSFPHTYRVQTINYRLNIIIDYLQYGSCARSTCGSQNLGVLPNRHDNRRFSA